MAEPRLPVFNTRKRMCKICPFHVGAAPNLKDGAERLVRLGEHLRCVEETGKFCRGADIFKEFLKRREP